MRKDFELKLLSSEKSVANCEKKTGQKFSRVDLIRALTKLEKGTRADKSPDDANQHVE